MSDPSDLKLGDAELGVLPEHMSDHFGKATAKLVGDVYAEGATRAMLLMRHSARTFDRRIHDLKNNLTDHGRFLCEELGAALPRDLTLKGYASPPNRCMETAEKIIGAHTARGGEGSNTRPVEAFGVFYVLDQRKMWRGLAETMNLASYIGDWFDGNTPEDALMPPQVAVEMILLAMRTKLKQARPGRTLDLCVTHDMTIFLMRHGVGLEPVDGPTVEFLDGLIMFERDGRTFLRSHHGGEVEV